MTYWNEKRLRIWREMTPEQRDYDRWVGVYPPGQGAYETVNSDIYVEDEEATCMCFKPAPCSYCVDVEDEDED